MAYVSSSTFVSHGTLLLALGGVTGRLAEDVCSTTQWIGFDLPVTIIKIDLIQLSFFFSNEHRICVRKVIA